MSDSGAREMLAILFDGAVRSARVPRPHPLPGEALVRVRLIGICNTDLEITRGYMGYTGVLGHEFVGEVAACEQPDLVGQRVVGEINLGCGACEACRTGLSRHCAGRRVLGILGKDGAMAEYLTLPVGLLHRVPEEVGDEVAVFTEPLAAAMEIGQQVAIAAGSHALVLGDGKLGLLVVQVLLRAGCQVTLLGHHPRKLELARAWGASAVADPGVLEQRYDLTVEATGSPSGLGLAVQRTRPRGTLVLKSTYAGTVELDLAPLVVDEITVVGSRCGPFAPALAALARGEIDTSELVTATYPLAAAKEAFAAACAPGAIKVLLQPDHG